MGEPPRGLQVGRVGELTASRIGAGNRARQHARVAVEPRPAALIITTDPRGKVSVLTFLVGWRHCSGVGVPSGEDRGCRRSQQHVGAGVLSLSWASLPATSPSPVGRP